MPGSAEHSFLLVLCGQHVRVHHAQTTRSSSPTKLIVSWYFLESLHLPAYLWIIAVSYRLGSKQSDSLGSSVTQPLNCHNSACAVGLLGHLGGKLSWMGTCLFFSLGCLASCSSHLCLFFGLFILWAASEVCIAALHTLLNILGLGPLLTSTELAIWICISLLISFYQTRLSA